MYLRQVKVVNSHRCFKKGQKFELRDITVIVGDQGCGKSTLVKGLQSQDKDLHIQLTSLGVRGVNSYYFDTEHMNPRMVDPQMYTRANGEDKGIGYNEAILTRFRSHGEVLRSYTVDCLKQAKECVLLLDEPESGLSLANQYKMWREIQEAVKRDCQVIMATHCLVIIQSIEEVLSLEHGKWMKSADFIKTQLEGCNDNV